MGERSVGLRETDRCQRVCLKWRKRGEKPVSRETRERKEQAVHPFQVGEGALPFS